MAQWREGGVCPRAAVVRATRHLAVHVLPRSDELRLRAVPGVASPLRYCVVLSSAETGAPSLSFCILSPMYNEEVNAERCVRALADALRTTPFRTGLMVIDDGSVDRTSSILKRLQGEVPSLVVVTHEVNQGYGAAVRTGIQQARLAGYTYILFMDSDLTNDPKYIPAFV